MRAPKSLNALVSRRSLIGTGGALGALSALSCLTGPSASAATGLPSALSATGVSLGGSTTVFGLADHPRSGVSLLSSGGGAPLTTVSVEVDGGHLLGVTFPAGTSAESVAVRVRTGGDWAPWAELPLNDSEPDPGTRDAAAAVKGSDPIWIGTLTGRATVQVRLPRADVATAQLHVVDTGSTTGTRLLAAPALSTTADEGQDPGTGDSGDAGGTGTGTDGTNGSDTANVVTKALSAPTIHSRAEWGADESLRKGSPSYSDTIKACVVHHTADGGTYTQSEVPSVVRGMYRYHTVSLGWADLGYNFVVDRFGGIWEGRAGGTTRPVVGAHAGGFNADTFGVSMMGDFTSVAPSDACLESVARVIAWKLSMYGLSASGSAVLTSAGGGTARYSPGTTVTLRTINAHRDVGFTACPGNVGFTKMGGIRSRVGALLTATVASATAIDTKYAALGGGSSFLGGPTTSEGTVPGGRGTFRFYRGGAIYASAKTGAHTLRGALLAEYARQGWERSGLGFPTTDDSPALNGSYNHFEGGSIYWSAATGAHDVRGAIRQKWGSLGWERGPLGYPVTGDSVAAGGWFTHFQNGSIYYSAATGAHVVRGDIRERWASLGWERGLGFPTTDDTLTPGGRGYYTVFQNGSVYWSPSTGAHAVRGAFRDAWAATGWENGYLGFPTRDEYPVSGGTRMDFEGGTATRDTRTGRVSLARKG